MTNRWTPSSRRHRRQRSRRSQSRGTSGTSDRILFAVAGLFVAALLVVLILVAFTTR